MGIVVLKLPCGCVSAGGAGHFCKEHDRHPGHGDNCFLRYPSRVAYCDCWDTKNGDGTWMFPIAAAQHETKEA